jgi:hypothetical protein
MTSEHADLACRIAEVDRLIHEPARLVIVMILYTLKEADSLYLQRETRLKKGNLSSHLPKLEDAYYIHIEKPYRNKIPLTLCSLTKTGTKAYQIYRDQVKQIKQNE